MKDLVAPVKTAAKRDWSLPRVGEVCRLINGRVYKKNELLQEGRYRVLRVGNFFTNQNWYFSDLELDTDKYCEDGDLLYAWSASFGPRIWRGEKTIYHYHIWKVEPDRRKVIRDFLYYFFEWDKDLIREEQGAGATMIHVSKKSMDARAIPLPPLEEQKRIVAVLDQAFAALERARAHTEANMASANDLFGSILDSTLAIDGKGWKRHPLKSLGAIQTGSTPKTSEAQNYGKHIPFIKPGDFRPDGSLVLDNEGLSDRGAAKARRVSPGSALMVCIGATIGKAGFTDVEIATNQQINSISPKDGVSGEFLYYQFITPAFQREMEKRSGQATLPIVNKSKWGQIEVAIPRDRDTQFQAVEKLRTVRRYTEELISAYRGRLEKIASLRQSLLQEAFSGRLT